MRTSAQLIEQKLPKWPQCIITGDAISEDQALEIIRRTDIFFNCPYVNTSNMRENHIANVLRFPSPAVNSKDFDRWDNETKEWMRKWEFVYIPYLYNDYVCCSCIQGPQGWCHPDGSIGYFYNIGKWPTIPEVYDSLNIIAKHWLFLQLEVTLMDREYGEENGNPVISFFVKNGDVSVVDPESRNLHEEFHRHVPDAEAISGSYWNELVTYGNTSSVSDDALLKWSKILD